MVAERLTPASSNGFERTDAGVALNRGLDQGSLCDLSTLADEVRRAVRLGRSVLPCWGIDTSARSRKGFACRCRSGASCDRPGKHPRVSNPYKAATNNLNVVEGWLARWPDANWAWMPGKTRHADLDIDYRRGGEEALCDFESRFGKLPDSERVLTGDGLHLTFSLPDGAAPSAGEIAPGIELKTGPTSYVILPGSTHFTGARYEYEIGYEPGEVDVSPLPQWILDLAGQSQTRGLKSLPHDLRSFEPSSCPPLDRPRLEGLLSPGRRLGRLWNHDKAIGGDRSPSGWDFKLLLALRRLGYTLENAFPVLLEHRHLYGFDTDRLYRSCRPGRHGNAHACSTEYVLWTWLRVVDYSKNAKPEAEPTRRVERGQALTAAYELRSRVYEAGGNPTHVLALEVMSTFARDCVCFMSAETLAPELHCKPRNAGYVLRFLEGHNFIKRLAEPRRGFSTVWELKHLAQV